jgi:T5SS/PEP-CTERM-associated repeat protein
LLLGACLVGGVAEATVVTTGTVAPSTLTTSPVTTGQIIVGFSGLLGALSIDASGAGNGFSSVTGNFSGGVGAIFGIGSGSEGSLSVTGDGSSGSASFASGGLIAAGWAGGTGTIAVSNGGVVETTRNEQFSGSPVQAGNSNSVGTITVDGAGSILRATDRIQIGAFDNSTGSLVVSNGGLVQTNPDPAINLNAGTVLTEIGTGNNASGTVTVTGAGSKLETTGLLVGFGAPSVSSQGTLTISDGGVVDVKTFPGGVGSGVSVGSALGSQISVTGSGSELRVSPITSGFNAGKEIIVGGFGTGTLLVEDFGAVAAAGANILVGGGFFGTNTDPGTLTVRDNGTVNAATVTVSQGGLLNGDGNIFGNVLLNGGTIAPGNSPGTLTVNGDMTLTSGLLEIEIGSLLSDHFDVSGVVSLGSGLLINLIFLDPPVANSELDIQSFFSGFSDFLVASAFDLTSPDNLLVSGLPQTPFSVRLGNQTVSFGQVSGTVPAPGSVLLVMAGLALIAVMRLRPARQTLAQSI